jgi:putative oxidoreductase
MGLGRLIARTVIGGLFAAHGLQKLLGWFGGPGREGTEKMAEHLELRPARANALLVGGIETVGGAMVVVGAATPLAASGLIGTMITAVRKVHLANGPWSTQGGYEYNLTLIAALVALVETGPGPFSVDHALGADRRGPAWALGSLALGAAASTAVIAAGRRWPEPEPVAAGGTAEDAAESAADQVETADGGEAASAEAGAGEAARASTATDASAPTRQELYEEARRLGIPGRSKMDKDELARAIADHR